MDEAVKLLCQRIDELEKQERQRVSSIVFWQHDDKIRSLYADVAKISTWIKWLEAVLAKVEAKRKNAQAKIKHLHLAIKAEEAAQRARLKTEEDAEAERQKINAKVAQTIQKIKKVKTSQSTSQ